MAVNLEEKRRFPRIKLRTPLRYQIGGTTDFNNVVSDNICLGGIGFINNKFVAPKTLVVLEVNILSRIIRPVGKVVHSSYLPHSDKYYLGVEFLEIDLMEKRYIADFIDIQIGKL